MKRAARTAWLPAAAAWLASAAQAANLTIAGEITRMFHGEIPASPNLPERPGPPWR